MIALQQLRERIAPYAEPVTIIGLIGSIGMSVYWFVRVPMPGKSVAMLGAVAVFMALRAALKPMHGSEVVLWTLVVFALLYIEIRAINKDRAEATEQQRATHEQEERNFQSIANGLKGAINESQRQFDATMSRTKTLLSTTQAVSVLTKKNLTNITGGKSFAFIRPQVEAAGLGPTSLIVVNHGDEVLTGVTIAIARTGDPNWGGEFFNRFTVGTIGPHDVAMIPITITPQPGKDGIDSYWAMISAQNGTVDETLSFKESQKHPGVWAVQFHVTRRVKLSGNASGFVPVMVRSWSDEPDPEQKIPSEATQIKLLKRSMKQQHPN